MEIKLNIGQEDGTSTQLTLSEGQPLYGKKIGDTVAGEVIDKPGYEFQITGGSNNSGVPMRWDVSGSAQRKILLSGGVGYKKKRRGTRVRKSVAGNTIGARTAQVNMKVTKTGKAPLTEVAEENTENTTEE